MTRPAHPSPALAPVRLNRRRLAAALGLAPLAPWLAACAPDKAAAPATSAAPASASGPQRLADGRLVYPESDFHAPAKGQPGGTLRASVALDTGSLDIHALSHGNIQWLGRLLFDGLVYQDEQGRPGPWLATSWTISPDGKTYTFKLREGVTFSDGAPFDAEAVKANLEHMRDPATKSPLAAAYIAPYLDGRVIDAHTFEARLREPYAPFLDVLAQSWLSMVSPKQIREAPKTLAERPIGTGPFVLESYTRNQGLVLTRRADYAWAPPVLGHEGPAYLERIELAIVPEAPVRHSALLAGQHDFTFDTPPQNAQALRADPGFAVHSRIRKGNPFRAITFNTTRAPFDDARVRQALARAIDREGLAAITGFGEFQVKADFLAANTRAYDPAFQGALVQDVAAANALLDAAGWTQRDAQGYRSRDGKRLAGELLMTESASFPSSVAVALQSDAKKIGLDITLKVLPTTQVSSLRLAGEFQMLGGGYWHTNTPDGLFILYHSASITTDKLIGQNASRLSDAALDDLLGRARRSGDAAEQAQLYSQAQKRLTELVPAIPTYESHHISAHSRRVHGLAFDTSHNTPLLHGVWLSKE